ncbi:MAG: hypothetical protein ACK4ND_13715 [Cytophagaceae bacterium]
MKQALRLFPLTLLAFFVLFSSCKKEEEPTPSGNNNNTNTHFPGDTEGIITIDGKTTEVSGRSNDSEFGFIMNPRNMNPPNSYPVVNVSFNSRPTEDGTYNLNVIGISISVHESEQNSDRFASGSTGSIDVKIEGSTLVASFEDVTLTNSSGDSRVVSGSITCY